MSSFPENIHRLALMAPSFLVAVIFHEVAHGYMAKHFGDATAEEAGRLTFNPLPHLDPIGTFLPLASMAFGSPILFGWAKPVPIDPRRFKRLRLGLFMVSSAGVMMNFFLAFASAFVYWGAKLWIPESSPAHEFVVASSAFSVTINYALAIFNLLPVPPLDGSKILESFLPMQAAIKFERLSRYGFVILILLLFTGALNWLQAPIYGASDLTVNAVARVFEAVYEFRYLRMGS